MPSSYTPIPANAASNSPSFTLPADGDTLNAASGATPWKLLADYVQRLVNYLTNATAIPNGLTITQATVNGDGIDVTANGTGIGISATGGSSAGTGAVGIGGAGGGTGVQGTSSSGIGVVGQSTGSAQPGVRGINSSTGPGGSFSGNATRPALHVDTQATPSTPANGDIWADSTQNNVRAMMNGIVSGTPLTVGGTGVGFSNGWQGPITNGRTPRYWKGIDGMVHLEGTVNSSAISSNIAFILPAGYRPTYTTGGDGKLYLPAILAGATTGKQVQVDGSGNVTVAGATAANVDYSLDGISFATF